jgi:hypothetical protein
MILNRTFPLAGEIKLKKKNQSGLSREEAMKQTPAGVEVTLSLI